MYDLSIDISCCVSLKKILDSKGSHSKSNKFGCQITHLKACSYKMRPNLFEASSKLTLIRTHCSHRNSFKEGVLNDI